MTISRETAIRIAVMAVVVVIAVLLMVYGDGYAPPLTTGPSRTPPGTSAEVVPPPQKGPPYSNCEAHADGRYNIPKGDPAYNPALDRNGDGVACNR